MHEEYLTMLILFRKQLYFIFAIGSYLWKSECYWHNKPRCSYWVLSRGKMAHFQEFVSFKVYSNTNFQFVSNCNVGSVGCHEVDGWHGNTEAYNFCKRASTLQSHIWWVEMHVLIVLKMCTNSFRGSVLDISSGSCVSVVILWFIPGLSQQWERQGAYGKNFLMLHTMQRNKLSKEVYAF